MKNRDLAHRNILAMSATCAMSESRDSSAALFGELEPGFPQDADTARIVCIFAQQQASATYVALRSARHVSTSFAEVLDENRASFFLGREAGRASYAVTLQSGLRFACNGKANDS